MKQHGGVEDLALSRLLEIEEKCSIKYSISRFNLCMENRRELLITRSSKALSLFTVRKE